MFLSFDFFATNASLRLSIVLFGGEGHNRVYFLISRCFGKV
jgi:hypothetical protein